MKKTLLLLFAGISLACTSQAQTSGGPDSYGYVWRDSNDPNGPAYNWIDIVNQPEAIMIHGLGDDNTVGPLHLPSSFPYYWNGYLVFTTNNALIASPFPSIPSSGQPQNYLAVMTTDLNLDTTAAGNTGQCWYWESATHDTVVVEWYNVPFWANATPPLDGQNTFEVILNYTDSTITYQYNTQVSSSAALADYCEVGIENNSGTIGLEWAHDVYPTPNYAIRYYPPASTTLQINDASTIYNNNPDNGASFISKAGVPFSLTTEVKNVGNTNLGTFNVQTLVKSASNANVSTNNTVVGPLTQGQTFVVNQPNPFNPVNAGVFRFITNTQLTGDATPTNNTQTVELDVVDTTTNTIELAYEDGTLATAGGLSWSGGDGGAANLFYPPFYPCDLTAVEAYLQDDPNVFGYAMMIHAVDSNGLPGALLDSVVQDPATEVIGSFNTSQLTAPIRIDSGGFFVTWYMLGDGTILGQNTVAPISNRSFEVLGGNYAAYRGRETTEHMIRAVISRVGVGIAENKHKDGFGDFYPNPSSTTTELTFDKSAFNQKEMTLSIFDVDGKLISSENVNSAAGKITVNVKDLAAGLYLAKIKSVAGEVTRKFNVIK
jgi:hypothetical protein